MERKTKFSTIKVNNKDIGEYVISGNLYEVEDTFERFSVVKSYRSISVMGSERLVDFAAKLENATGISFSIVEHEKLSEHEGNYIMLDDTNPDFSSYEIKIENGNIILYANYYSLNDCINSFFADIIGYNLDKGQITGAESINITEGKKYKFEKSEIYTKEKLMSVLEEIYNDDSRMIVGQQMSQGVTIGEVFDLEITNYKEGCGVEPALLGWDVVGTMIYPQNRKNLESARVKIAYQMVEYMRDGGIITLSTHFPNPLDEKPSQGDSIKGAFGYEEEWDELFREGTAINKRFMGYLEQLGDFLEILDKNGAPIILRPLFESNGNWTWYSIGARKNGVTKKISSTYVSSLWILMYDYLVKTRGLENLIWVYSPNVMFRGGTEKYGAVMDCYPGDNYVDIVAVDWYPKNEESLRDPVILTDAYEDLTVPTGKIFVYGELSAGPGLRTMGDNYTFTAEDYADMLINFAEKGVKSAYALSWSSWVESGVRVKLTMYEMTKGKEFYANNSGFLDKEATRELLYH